MTVIINAVEESNGLAKDESFRVFKQLNGK